MVTMALLSASYTLKAKNPFETWIGTTVCSDTFYQGQNRKDTFAGYIPNHIIKMNEWQKLGVLNYDMESSIVLLMGTIFGGRAGVITGVLINRTQNEIPDEGIIEEVENITIEIANNAIVKIIEWDKKGSIEINIPNLWSPNNIVVRTLLKEYKKRTKSD